MNFIQIQNANNNKKTDVGSILSRYLPIKLSASIPRANISKTKQSHTMKDSPLSMVWRIGNITSFTNDHSPVEPSPSVGRRRRLSNGH